jgi:hypothetical protein
MEKTSFATRSNAHSWVKLTGEDSSGEDKKPSNRYHALKSPLSPRLSAKWPRHLKALYEDLSATDPVPEVGTAIELLHALKLDTHACNALCTAGVVAKMIDELKHDKMHFREVLTSRPSFSVLIFQRLVTLDVHAARRFVRLCSPKLQPHLYETHAFVYMHDQLQRESSFLHTEAKREKDLFVEKVAMKIKEGSDVCAKELAPFIQGCPESARQKVLKLLANDEVHRACASESPPYELTDAIRNLEVGARRNKASPELGLLLVRIDTVMSEVEADANKEAKARKEKSSGLRCLMDDKVIALIKEVEDGVKSHRLDLQTVIARLCPGERTTQAQAKFVAGLMGHLIQGAHERHEPIDYERLLSAALQSGMPRSCTMWIAGPVVEALPSAEEAKRLITAMEAIITNEAPQLSKALTFPPSATIVSDDDGKPTHVTSPNAERKSPLSLKWVIDNLIGAVVNSRVKAVFDSVSADV